MLCVCASMCVSERERECVFHCIRLHKYVLVSLEAKFLGLLWSDKQ